MIEIKVSPELEGLRLNRFLRKLLVNATLTFVYKLIRTKVKINGKKTKQNYLLKKNDQIRLYISKEEYSMFTEKTSKSFQKRLFNLLYEDESILILEKPAGLASQPGTGVMESNVTDQVDSYLQNKSFPINRLDRATHGIMLFAKDRKTANLLYAMSKSGKIEKYYLALVKGKMKGSGKMEDYLERINDKFQHKSKISTPDKGKKSVTEFEVLNSDENASLLELRLHTGRMHQIRVQLLSRGHPVIGDTLYGDTNQKSELMLFAYKIRFIHPITNKLLEIRIKTLLN